MPNTTAGIDFGTSNSSAGVMRDGAPTLVSFGQDGTSVPSAIFYADESKEVSFGKRAVAQYSDGVEGRLLRSLKSVLGSSLMQEKTTIRNKRMLFSDIIQDFFTYLKTTLDESADQPVEQVVVGRPVHFVDDDQQRDVQAQEQLSMIAQQAGFKDVEFQFEPIAAALNYESSLNKEELVLVVDIGGGTADFTIIRLSPDQHQHSDRSTDILATMGVHIGGTDFDRSLSLTSVMPLMGMGSSVKGSSRLLPNSLYFDLATWHRIPLLYNSKTIERARQMQLDAEEKHQVQRLIDTIEGRFGHAIARSVEQSKITLSEELSASYSLSMLKNSITRTIDRSDFEEAIDSLIEQLCACVSGGLTDAQLQAQCVSSVFYTGGSSSVPCLQRRLQELFPLATQVQGDTFGSVGLGLTIEAARKFS